jgi:DNA-binding IclR family transcriptional regulator
MRNTEVPALARAISVLEQICVRPAAARDLRRELSVPLASLYRILNQLEAAGLLRQDSAGLFHPGYGLLSLGHGARMHSHLIAVARPILQQITRQTGQMSELTVPTRRLRILKLDVWLTAEAPVRLHSRPGHTAGISHRSALGMAYLVFGSGNALARYLKNNVHDAYRCDRLTRLGARFRRDGYTAMEQYRPVGIGRVVVPFYHLANGELGGALSVVTEASRLTKVAVATWARIMQSHIPEVEKALAQDSSGK